MDISHKLTIIKPGVYYQSKLIHYRRIDTIRRLKAAVVTHFICWIRDGVVVANPPTRLSLSALR